MEESRIRQNAVQSAEVDQLIQQIQGSQGGTSGDITLIAAVVTQGTTRPGVQGGGNPVQWRNHAVCLIAATVLMAIGIIYSMYDSGGGGLVLAVCYVLAMPLFITAGVLQMIYLHRGWSLLKGLNRVRTTPGRAVGLLFVPLFNLYWMFVAWYGWAQEYNRYVDATGRGASERVSEGWFLAHCILMVSGIGLIATPVTSLVTTHQLCRSINSEASRT